MALRTQVVLLAAVAGVCRAANFQALMQHQWASDFASARQYETARGGPASAGTAPKTYALRLCNAYAWPAPLEMRRMQEPKLVEYPLPYKSCHDYTLPLAEGDELQFRAGDLNIGAFSVRGLPPSPSMLLLIPHRKHQDTMAVAFDSHVFAMGGNPQVALVDAFTGPRRSGVLLHEKEHMEELQFNSVVTLTPGSYQVNLATNDKAVPSQLDLHAKLAEKYVVIRMGDAQVDPSSRWPEELVVFPRHAAGSSATHTSCAVGVLVLVACHLATNFVL